MIQSVNIYKRMIKILLFGLLLHPTIIHRSAAAVVAIAVVVDGARDSQIFCKSNRAAN